MDECSARHQCDSSATCHNTDGSYTCTCDSGYSGDGRTCYGKYTTGTSSTAQVSQINLSQKEGNTNFGLSQFFCISELSILKVITLKKTFNFNFPSQLAQNKTPKFSTWTEYCYPMIHGDGHTLVIGNIQLTLKIQNSK